MRDILPRPRKDLLAAIVGGPIQLLTESDGPFAQINGRPLSPWEVSDAATELAKILRTKPDDVEKTLRQNLEKLMIPETGTFSIS